MRRVYFAKSRSELVSLCQAGDAAAREELIARGRDPETGQKTRGLASRISKPVGPSRKSAASRGSKTAPAAGLRELKREAAALRRRYNDGKISHRAYEAQIFALEAQMDRAEFGGSKASKATRNPSLRTSRQRKKMMKGVQIYHADHGISQKQKAYIVSQLRKSAPQGFFVKQVSIPAGLGPVPNALYGPDAGDAPVHEDEVYYASRGGRPVQDRLVRAAPRPWDYVQTIGIRDGNNFTLFTIYGGPLAPMHPEDPNNRDPEGSRQWWSQHALADGQWSSAAK